MDRQQLKLFQQSQVHAYLAEKTVPQSWQANESVLPLEVQLCCEKTLNRLSGCLNQCVASFAALEMETDLEAVTPLYGNAKEQVFQILLAELHSLLRDHQIEIALPVSSHDANSQQPSVTLSEKINWAGSNQLWQILSSETDVIQLIADDTLQALKTHSTIAVVWPMQISGGCLAWLFIYSRTESHAQSDTIVAETTECCLPLLTTVIDQSVLCAVQALNQLELSQRQRQKYHLVVSRNRELEKNNQLKSQFLANTSHEIRTPLSSILGFTHLLLQQGYNPINLRHQEYLKIILSSGQHLLALINDILDLSKIEANQLTLQYEELEVAEVCKVATTLVREKASDKGLTLQLEIAPTVLKVRADGLRLKQMLFNLLSNAVKFTVKGFVGLQVLLVDGYIRFTIWDTGTGISHEQQKLLFKPYSQVANAAVSWGEGTGLGLVLTQKLAELHGGWVEVISELNQGSSFTIVLPDLISSSHDSSMMERSTEFSGGVDTPASESSVSNQRIQESQPDTLLTRPLLEYDAQHLPAIVVTEPGLRLNGILLVEDNYYNAKLILTYLTHRGYEVTWAKTGAEMWQALARSLPAVILMDINLPDTNGITLIQQLKQDDRYLMIPIIAQTAMAMKGDRDRCLASGADGYISKPIDLEALSRIVFEYANCRFE